MMRIELISAEKHWVSSSQKNKFILIIIWNFHRIVNSLRAVRKNLTIHWTFSKIFTNHESFKISSSNSCNSWLSHETKKMCFNSSKASSSLHKVFIVEHVSMTNVFILQNWLCNMSTMWLKNQRACVFAFMIFTTSVMILATHLCW